jgi:arginyl-tRNA synthetase
MGQEKTVLRADGTSIYITQDLALGKLRYDDFCMDRMIYVVGNEQEDHFRALFHLFKQLGFSFADKCFHLSYGMIELPDGKMKSREGNVVDADTLADEMEGRVRELLLERYPDLDSDEIIHRSRVIAMAAIKFFILKYDAKKGFVFDRDHSLDFAGETGPYVLYSYARCRSILEKQEASSKKQEKNYELKITNYEDIQLNSDEKILLGLLSKFPETIEQAAKEYAPALIARYLLSLAAQRNTYYHHTKILEEDGNYAFREFRLIMVVSIAEVLKQGLNLLGIEVLEKM